MFCSIAETIDKDRILFETSEWVAIYDGYPVTPGHTLLIPKEHHETYFDLPDRLKDSLEFRLEQVKKLLDEKFHPDGYNVGFNCGEAAGQTVMHFHMHLIPRRINDHVGLTWNPGRLSDADRDEILAKTAGKF